MTGIRRFFGTTSLYANAAVLLALLIWVTKIAVLDSIPELFEYGRELGVILEVVLSQIVASYIFYLFFVHAKELKDRGYVEPYIMRNCWLIYNDARSQITEVASASSTAVNFDETVRREVIDLFAKIPMRSNPNMVGANGQKATWVEYVSTYAIRLEHWCEHILQLGGLVEPKLIRILTAISDAAFPKALKDLPQLGGSHHSINALGGSASDYVDLCRELGVYIEAKGYSLTDGKCATAR